MIGKYGAFDKFLSTRNERKVGIQEAQTYGHGEFIIRKKLRHE